MAMHKVCVRLSILYYTDAFLQVFGIFTGTGHYIRRVNIPRAQFSTKEDPSR